MKKPQNNKHCKECEDLVNKSNTAFITCEWIESQGNDILDRLDAIEFLGWSKENELLKEQLTKQLLFLVQKGQFEIKNLDVLENKLNKLRKKYAKS